MGFLDNSGDITLDAVLTDTGRMRLAKGDGSFRITSFALGDDEINYSLYDKNNIGGTAAYDLSILQTPVLEAFTNNIASLNSRLVSYSNNNLLFLPVIKVNNIAAGNAFATGSLAAQGFILAVDKTTEEYLKSTVKYNSAPIGTNNYIPGLLTGFTPSGGSSIRIDQGIDNTQVPAAIALDPDQMETQYLIEIDNRIAYLTNKDGTKISSPSYIDDDMVAAYYISKGVDNDFFTPNTSQDSTGQVIAGSRGDTLYLKLSAALEVSTTDYLFNKLGTNETSKFSNPTTTKIMSILTSINITGLTTGAFLTIPILAIKKIS